MNRVNEFMDFLREDMAQQYIHMCESVQSKMLKNPSIMDEKLLAVISELLVKRAQQEELDNTLEPVCYLVISPLHSSLLTQSYEYAFMLMDETLYLDRNITEVFWRPPYIFDNIQQDADHFQVQLKKKFVGVKQYELDELRVSFAVAHLGLFNAMIMEYAGIIESSENWKLIKRCDKVQIMLGGYMDKLLPLKEFRLGEAQP